MSKQTMEKYLDSLYYDDGTISEDVFNCASRVWTKINLLDLNLEVPDACPGYRDNLMFTWLKGEHYLECEVFGNGIVEFFYFNKESEQTYSEDTEINAKLSAEILEKLNLFTNQT